MRQQLCDNCEYWRLVFEIWWSHCFYDACSASDGRGDDAAAATVGDAAGGGHSGFEYAGDADDVEAAGMGSHTTGDGASTASGDGRGRKRRSKDGNKHVRKKRKAAHASERDDGD